MKTLSFDPGAAKMGWACLESEETILPPIYHDSGLIELPRGDDEAFQTYKLRVIHYWAHKGRELLEKFKPDEVVSEIVPAMGFERSVQNQLAQAAITSVQSTAFSVGFSVEQIGATTVKKAIGGNGHATKATVRNGVVKLIPELRPMVKQWTKVFDEPDSIAVGLCHLGYRSDIL